MTDRLRDIFDRVPGQAREHPLLAGAITVLVLLVVTVLIISRETPLLPENGRFIKAEFEQAPRLQAGEPVLVAGIKVGEVESVEPSDQGRGATVTLQITDDGVEVKRNARAAILFRTLLEGQRFIDLDPGTPSAPAIGDATIPVSRTRSEVSLEEVLEPLDGNGRDGVRAFMREFERGFRGRAAGDFLDQLPSAARAAAEGLPPLHGEEPGDLTEAIRGLSRTMGAVSQDERNLAGLVHTADVTFGVMAARRSDLAATLVEMPAALRETRATAVRLQRTLPLVTDLAERLRPGARRLPTAAENATRMLEEATPLLRETRGLLARLDPALRSLRTRVALPGIDAMSRLGPVVDRTNADLIPWLETRDRRTQLKLYETIGPVSASAAGIYETTDAVGHYSQFEASVGERPSSTGVCEATLTDEQRENLFTCTTAVDTLFGLLGLQDLDVIGSDGEGEEAQP